MAKKADWGRIEQDYRSGLFSVRELAKKYGVSDTAIRKKAIEKKWPKNSEKSSQCEPSANQAEQIDKNGIIFNEGGDKFALESQEFEGILKPQWEQFAQVKQLVELVRKTVRKYAKKRCAYRQGNQRAAQIVRFGLSDRAEKKGRKMKKSNQQSRSGWGGKRAGAGAPLGNTNAVKHGERSRQAFFTLDGAEHLPPLISLRANNLVIAERIGELRRTSQDADPAIWRELMLLDGIMWQHTRRMIRMEMVRSKLRLAQAKAAMHSVSKSKRASR